MRSYKSPRGDRAETGFESAVRRAREAGGLVWPIKSRDGATTLEVVTSGPGDAERLARKLGGVVWELSYKSGKTWKR